MKRIIIHTGIALSIAVLLFSCKKDDTTPAITTNYYKCAEALSENSSFNVEMFSEDSLFVGYNVVYFRIKNNPGGEVQSLATVVLRPVMDMGTFKHSCPCENPASGVDSEGFFKGIILFSMPGTNSWSVDAEITADGKTDSVHLALTQVSATIPARKIVVIDSLEITPGTWTITKYPVSLVPQAWKVGINPFEITIHRMASMFSFPPVTDLAVEITPEMPSMGHGSPNNVNPVHTVNGHYYGSVNFTMTGEWRIHLAIKKEGRLITDKAYFDVTF
jgi:hypothetical protein